LPNKKENNCLNHYRGLEAALRLSATEQHQAECEDFMGFFSPFIFNFKQKKIASILPTKEKNSFLRVEAIKAFCGLARAYCFCLSFASLFLGPGGGEKSHLVISASSRAFLGETKFICVNLSLCSK
jgi:hypothetical protein